MIPDLPLEELARRYNNGAAVPDWMDTLLPRWQQESERVRRDAAGARDVAYGPLPRNCYDVFTPQGAAPAGGWPTLFFIHGGYWQRLYKDDWSVIAAPFVAQGMAAVAERAGMQREGLYRALSPKGNPTLKTLLAILGGAGLRLAVTRRNDMPHPA